MNELMVMCAGAILLLGCDLDIRTGVRGDPRTDSSPDSSTDAGADTTTPDAPGDAASESLVPPGSPDAGTGADADAAAATFFPTMFVSIDGVLKGFRLSALSPDSKNPDLIRLEFATGLRSLANEATPGEVYSEVWLFVTTGGAPVSGTYGCAPGGGTPDGTPSVALFWSYNHIATSRHDFGSSGGPCTATFTDFGMEAGARIRGTFSGTLDGGHTLSGGTFDLIVPSLVPPAGQ